MSGEQSDLTLALLEDAAEAEGLLRLLRPNLDDATFAKRLSRAVAQGYRVFAAYMGGALAGALGFRLTDDLCWGRTLFVDDLIVAPNHRGQGVGALLLDQAQAHAAREDCDHLRLCSGLTREAAHRFYMTQGLSRSSIQFVVSLSERRPS